MELFVLPPRRWLQLRQAAAYKGWGTVFVSFVCIALVFASSTAAMPLIYGPVIDEFGWSRTKATLVFTYKNAASAMTALCLVGPMCERFGLRRVTVGAFVTTATAMVSFLWVSSIWGYYLAGIALGAGVSATFVTAKILVSRWFNRNQGLALGMMLAGTSVGGMLAPLAYAWLESALGWRAAFAGLSLGIWAIALPLYLAKADENPTAADLRLEPGFRHHFRPRAAPEHASLRAHVGGMIAQPAFWLIVSSLLLVAAADAGVMQHTALFLERDVGLTTSAAAAALSGIFALGLVAKIGAGSFYDRYSLKGISVWYILLALSIALAFSVTGALTLIVFAAMRGIAHGGLMPEPAIIAKHCYGPHLLHMTISMFIGIWALGAAFGPVLLSLLYDAQGTYRNGFLLLIVFSVIAAIMLSRVRAAHHGSVDSQPTERTI